MKRASLGLFLAALLGLTACSSSTPSTTELDGKLSANSREAQSEVQATASTRRRPRTTTTRRRPNTTTTRRRPDPTVPNPTTPTTPTTMSRTGVAGVVIYEKNCTSDRPCSYDPGPAALRLMSGKTVVSRSSARDSGAFVIEAAPGNYTLEAKPPTKGQACDPVPVTVPADGYVTVQVICGAR